MVVSGSRPSAGLDDARVMGRAGDAPDVTNRAGRGEQAHGAAVERRRHADRAARSSPPARRTRCCTSRRAPSRLAAHDAAVEAVHAHGSVLAARDVRAGAEERDVLRRGARGQPQQWGSGRRARRPLARSAHPTSPRHARRPAPRPRRARGTAAGSSARAVGFVAAETSRTATCVAFVPSATHRRRPSALNERWRAGPGTCARPTTRRPDEIDRPRPRRASTR